MGYDLTAAGMTDLKSEYGCKEGRVKHFDTFCVLKMSGAVRQGIALKLYYKVSNETWEELFGYRMES